MIFRRLPRIGFLAVYLSVAVGADVVHPYVHGHGDGVDLGFSAALFGGCGHHCGHHKSSPPPAERSGGQDPDQDHGDEDCSLCVWSVIARGTDVPEFVALPSPASLVDSVLIAATDRPLATIEGSSIRGPPRSA